jgi:ketosteroid isomerase-like protein
MSESAGRSPEEVVSELFRAFDALDLGRVEAIAADDIQGVDELSGGWRRGLPALRTYFDEIKNAGLGDVHSATSDVTATVWGDTAVVTLVLDQTYSLGEEPQRIHAPTSVVMRREGDDWRLVLIHSVPLPEQAG